MNAALETIKRVIDDVVYSTPVAELCSAGFSDRLGKQIREQHADLYDPFWDDIAPNTNHPRLEGHILNVVARCVRSLPQEALKAVVEASQVAPVVPEAPALPAPVAQETPAQPVPAPSDEDDLVKKAAALMDVKVASDKDDLVKKAAVLMGIKVATVQPVAEIKKKKDPSPVGTDANGKLATAKTTIQRLLGAPMPLNDFQVALRSEQVSVASEKRARSELGVVSEKRSGGVWYVCLPAQPVTAEIAVPESPVEARVSSVS
jgi:hypothetical protein